MRLVGPRHVFVVVSSSFVSACSSPPSYSVPFLGSTNSVAMSTTIYTILWPRLDWGHPEPSQYLAVGRGQGTCLDGIFGWTPYKQPIVSSFFNRFQVKLGRPILAPEFGRPAGFGQQANSRRTLCVFLLYWALSVNIWF